MQSTTYYIGLFVVMCMIVLGLLVFAPSQNILLNLETECPPMHWALRTNYKKIIEEILNVTGATRDDMPDISHMDNSLKVISIKQPHICGTVDVIPIYYDNKYVNNQFSILLSTLREICGFVNISSVFLWRLYPKSSIGEHSGKNDEQPLVDHNTLRYTIAVNPMAVTEEECSLWVDGKIKKMALDDSVLWDPNHNYSLHNDTYSDDFILFLNIDFEHPKQTIPIIKKQ